MTEAAHEADSMIEQLAQRVSALERLAETRDILDRTEALAARQRQHVEQSRTELLEKISRTQDEHGVALAEILSLLRGSSAPGAGGDTPG